MAYQAIFKRYEIKYILNKAQKDIILQEISPYMHLDSYGKTTIRNLYFDTDNYLLIRRSIEKPVYKEKLRIRSYSKTDENTAVFVELKKKYKSVVYKRRISLTEKDSLDWICNNKEPKNRTQIINEIDYFKNFYKTLKPTCFLSYEREAYYSKDGSDLRITFDDNILCRDENLTLSSEIYGTPILDDDKVLMEIKSATAIPLWLTSILTREKIFKTSFSKYGTAYKTIIFPKLKGEIFYE